MVRGESWRAMSGGIWVARDVQRGALEGALGTVRSRRVWRWASADIRISTSLSRQWRDLAAKLRLGRRVVVRVRVSAAIFDFFEAS